MNIELIELELFVAKLLRRGVLIAGLLILVGWMLQISFKDNVFTNYHEYHAAPLLFTLHEFVSQKAYSKLIAYFGLAVLISLPILRVIMTGIIFLKQKNFRMAGLVAIVLIGLTISLCLGFAI